MTVEERQIIQESFTEIAKTTTSHKDALNRLIENQTAEHKSLVEQAAMINQHSQLLEDIQKVWTKNFEELNALVKQHSKFLEALRAVVLPHGIPDETVN